ncbi:MAG TPA: hypothetical protein VNX21_03805, partial [Candidatus Thermoplasmatota archaeon]|nr:hypothetical protein [Candidatus Thermoplasmatota archaeon]
MRTHLKRLTTTAVLAALLLAAAPSPTTAAGDLWGLKTHYRDFEVVALDPTLTAADAADGRIDLTLFGRTYTALVAPAPWAMPTALGRMSADGTVVLEPLAFPPQAFLGTVEGESASRVLLSITEAGVAGLLQSPGVDLELYPVSTHNDLAPRGLTVVVPVSAILLPNVPHREVETPRVPVDEAAPPAKPDGILQASPGPDRTALLFAESDTVRSSTTWSTRIFNAYNTLNAAYDPMVGFNFVLAGGVLYYCADETCDGSWGLNTNDASTLLVNWGNKLRDFPPTSYEIAQLIIAHTVPGYQGGAWQPGRYGFTDLRGISDAYFTRVMGHEFGHGFNGDHGQYSPFPGRAQSWAHDHGFNHVHTVCDLSV